ncbi:MAG: cohesin domain-containing protein [candidate division KSB1 bacterium]
MELNMFDEFWFKVKIQSAHGVFAVECQILYPPDILAPVLDADGAVVTRLGTFLGPGDNEVMLNARLEDDQPGKIIVALNKFGDETPNTGAGSLFDVLFHCVGEGEGEIRFAQSRISDAEDKTFSSKWASAKIKVAGINIVSVDIDVVSRGAEPQELEVMWDIAG